MLSFCHYKVYNFFVVVGNLHIHTALCYLDVIHCVDMHLPSFCICHIVGIVKSNYAIPLNNISTMSKYPLIQGKEWKTTDLKHW